MSTRRILKQIGQLEALLADTNKVLAVIKEDMKELKEKYNDPRRTVIREG